ncbi:MAG TPA: peptidylprolyl isomerase [Thermomicrobiales bacterium]|nr:peptidylprolyl isomerase [Thermomicrobiales bacterium]
MKVAALVFVAAIVMAACGDEDGRSTATTASQDAPVATQGSDSTQAIATVGSQGESVSKQWSTEPEMQLESGKDYGAIIRTNLGEIVVDLFEGDAPRTVNNFVFLANQGYYEGVPFHRVIKDFMVQTGDPTGTGAGSPGYRFADEPVTREYLRGTLAMANAGPNTNGSQFFIIHQDYGLPKQYTIFGIVTDGFDVLDAIAASPVTTSARGERSVPTVPLNVESIEITVR